MPENITLILTPDEAQTLLNQQNTMMNNAVNTINTVNPIIGKLKAAAQAQQETAAGAADPDPSADPPQDAA